MTTSLKALWLTQGYPNRLDPIAGIFHKTQAEALSRTGVKVEVVSPLPSVPLLPWFPSKWNRYQELEIVSYEGVVTVYRPRYPAFPAQSKWASPHLVMERRTRKLKLPRPDLIHAHFAYPQGLMSLGLAREWRTPVVLTLHGCDVNTYPAYNQTAKRRFIRTVCACDEVIAVSEALAERTRELTGRKPRVMPIGINLSAFSKRIDKREARRQLGLPEEEFIVLYVGYLLNTKGVSELLQALRLLHSEHHVRGVFVGDGPLLDEVRSTMNTVAAGTQPNEKIPLYMAAADVLVLPSYKEGLPTVLVESGAAGIPVVATAVGGIPELLQDGRGWLVERPDPQKLAQTLVRVRLREEEARIKAERYRTYIADHYDADKNAQKLGELYEDVISHKMLVRSRTGG